MLNIIDKPIIQPKRKKQDQALNICKQVLKEKYPTLTGIHTINWVISKIIVMMSYKTRDY